MSASERDDASDDVADRERTRAAAMRDLLAGAGLLALGVLLGGASWMDGADGVDVAFDVLGAAWLLWGLARLVRARSGATSRDRPGRTPRPRS